MLKYSKEFLETLCKQSLCVTDVARLLNRRTDGNGVAYLSKLIKKFKIDTSHFLSVPELCKLRNKSDKTVKHWQEVLVNDRNNGRKETCYLLKRCMIESGIEYKCQICSNTGEWNNQPLILQVDHIDGDWLNNNKNNLRFLCPNCHTQTDTFGSKNTIKKVYILNQCKYCNKPTKNKYYCNCKCANKDLNKNRYIKIKNKPTKDKLKDLIENNSWCAIGRMYGVTDNSIRKWARKYNLI